MRLCGTSDLKEELDSTTLEALRLSKKIDQEIQAEAASKKPTPRVLILGTGDAGKSTVLKQLKLLYGSDYTPAERADFAQLLRENLLNTAKLLIRSMETLNISYGGGPEEGGSSEETENAKAAAGVLQAVEIPAKGSPIASGVVEALVVLWQDPGVQQCVLRGNEFALLDSCEFLMQHSKEICAPSYVPSNEHILRVRVVTTAVSETKLTVKGSSVSFFDVGGQKRFRAKWAPYFDDVNAIIFVSSLACYDQKLEEDETINRMEDSISAFGCICNHTLLKHIPIILFLNKSDVYAKKVKTSPISQYFPDYTGSKFFRSKFLAANRNPKKQIMPHYTWATDTDQTRNILADVTSIVVVQDLDRAGGPVLELDSLRGSHPAARVSDPFAMKQRFSSIDVAAIVTDLRSQLLGLRVANSCVPRDLPEALKADLMATLYDVNPKTFLLKFAKPDLKEILLIESGIRLHTTVYARDKNKVPGGFATKLRKHLKSRRLCEIRQVGTDRIVDLRFGDNEFAFHLIVELYAAGNIVLTDSEYKILALLRTVDLADATVQTAAHSAPTIHSCARSFRDQRSSRNDIWRLQQNVGAAEAPAAEPSQVPEPEAVSKGKKGKGANAVPLKAKKKFEKKKDSAGGATVALKKWAREKFGMLFGPALVDHALAVSGLDPNFSISGSDDASRIQEAEDALFRGFTDASEIMVKTLAGTPCKGWITQKAFKSDDSTTSTAAVLLTFEEYHPHLFSHLSPAASTIAPPLDFPTFDKAVDHFYSLIESQRLAHRARQLDLAAAKKMHTVRANHATQVAGLAQMGEVSALKAATIEANLGTGGRRDWDGEEEKARAERARSTAAAAAGKHAWLSGLLAGAGAGTAAVGGGAVASVANPVVDCIVGVKMESGLVTVEFMDPEFEESDSDSDGDEDGSNESSESDGSSDDGSAAAKSKRQAEKNAKKAEAAKREKARAAEKARGDVEKTVAAGEKALKHAEKKIQQELRAKEAKAPAMIRAIRKPYWFEKFMWFVSSENYLVLAGRDAIQTDMLLRRYLGPGDAVVHADLEGAPVVLVKNPYELGDPAGGKSEDSPEFAVKKPPPGVTKPQPVPPLTLHQAGTMVVAQSKAWESKIVTSPWWIRADQVDLKEGGLIGALIYKGRKQFLPPVQLIYGFGLLFQVDDSSVQRHFDERRPWLRSDAWAAELATATDGAATAETTHEEQNGEPDQNATILPSDEDDSDVVDDGEVNEAGESKGNTASDGQLSDAPIAIIASFEKYNIASVPDEDDIEASEPEDAEEPPNTAKDKELNEGGAPTGKRRISAKERRDLKKKGAVGFSSTAEQSAAADARANEGDDDAASTAPAPSVASTRPSRTTTAGGGTSLAALPRGKRGKLKKMKDKYADQDDEDREVMLEVLGSAKGAQRAAEEAENAARKEAEAAAAKRRKEEAAKRAAVAIATRGAAKIKAAGERRRVGAQEAGGGDGEDDGDDEEAKDGFDFRMLGNLTAQPHPEDVLLAAIPVCAPWTCMGKYKYKAKMTPGSLKKGKAAKAVMTVFENAAKAESAAKEKELIETIPSADPVNAMLGKVNITGAAAGDKAKKGSGKDETALHLVAGGGARSEPSHTPHRGDNVARVGSAASGPCTVGRSRNGRRASSATSKRRTAALKEEIANGNFSPTEKSALLQAHHQTETAHLRARRTRLRLPAFEILEQVGQGGYGQVFLARKRDTRELCAVKRSSKRQLVRTGELQHALTERDVLSRTEGASWLVRLLYAFQDVDFVYLAMEYVPGGDMRTLLNNSGVLREDHARFYIAEMFVAIAELHRLGYIHRDLKPENYLIDAAGHLKLTDFGLSRGKVSDEIVDKLKYRLEKVKDTTYFDDFSNEKDMAMYHEVQQRQAAMDLKVKEMGDGGRAEVEEVRRAFVGYTFRHREAKRFGGVGGGVGGGDDGK
ncbi:G-protein alpha subunit-domain-containing protein [Zopfochytrium polystomum]|nr:G-protein alpha subunit-domain-containing protein [Zopfochytrium polystomum]